MWVAVDDTDSLAGMCTTFLANRLIEQFAELDVIGAPRLVRLNPTIPWKTRGNGAVAIRFGRGRGDKAPVAALGEKVRLGHAEADASTVTLPEVCLRASNVVARFARLEDERTNPGVVVTDRLPGEAYYWRAVRGVVTMEEARQEASRIGAEVREFKNGRGIIGALGALAWPGNATAYELIAYRERDRWGTPRRVEKADVIGVSRSFPTTFDNYDAENDDLTMVPSSPCPILFGLRGLDANDLRAAVTRISGEPRSEWTLFSTNHASDDHIVPRTISTIQENESVALTGEVASSPAPRRGGHVFFDLRDETGRIQCAAFEPTRGFRAKVLELRLGDKLTVFGSVSGLPDRCVNLEKFHLLELSGIEMKFENPICPECRKHMKSAGHANGYRCKACGTKAPNAAARQGLEPRSIDPGWHEVPTCARRHLARPVRLILQTRADATIAATVPVRGV
jgi:tRNA(Ile2)-agmatinylcytidine synthase